nr:hypothetical protein BaRGS_032125 [Batillaria attramentaria]
MSCRIAHAGQLSESFEVKTGVRQGCLLSLFLLLLVIDWIMKTTTSGRKNGIQWTLWTQLDDLDFADDLAHLSHSHSQTQDKTTCLEATSAGTGLKINRKKTKLTKINTTANTPVTVGGEPIREVESFVYLGSVADGQGGTDRDITARIGKARAPMIMLKNIWASKVISTRTNLRIFNSNVKSVLLYRCETWRITKTMQQKILTFFNTCLRRIFNSDGQRRSETKSYESERDRNHWPSRSCGGSGAGLDTPHPQEASIQHHTPSPDMEPAGEKEERPASQQLEDGHSSPSQQLVSVEISWYPTLELFLSPSSRYPRQTGEDD